MFSIKISSPTCEELGIPRDCDDSPCVPIFPTTARIIKNPSLHFDGLRYEASIKGVLPKRDPFSPLCIIPLPSVMAEQGEPNCIGKRNERERERVRCVNEGYSRLREHLPLERKDKRISKVDTLRKAIDYIKHLEDILAQDDIEDNHDYNKDSFVDSDSHSSSSPSRSRYDAEICDSFSDTDSNITDSSDSYHRKRPLEVSDVEDKHVQCSEKRKCVHNA